MGTRGRVVRSCFRVTAVKNLGGRPSTTVHVEVECRKLREAIGEYGGIKQAVARIPEEREGAVRWTRERMLRAACPRSASSAEVEAFTATHYGGCDADRYGIGVELETNVGSISPLASGEAYAVHGPCTPGESAPTRWRHR